MWNAAHSRSAGITLEPVRWETHAHPASGDRAQAIINRQIVADADLVIGLFRFRMGTPTGVAASGTAEEIETLRRKGKPVLLYFYDSAPPADHDQQEYARVQDYRRQMREGTLYWTYKDLAELERLSTRHIAQTLNEIATHLGAAPTTDKAPPKVVALRPQTVGLSNDRSDTWRLDGEIPAAVVGFRNEPGGAELEGVMAQITYFQANGGEVQRVDYGTWISSAYNRVSFHVGDTRYLIIAAEIRGAGSGNFAIENTRSKSAEYETSGSVAKELPTEHLDVTVRLIGGDSGTFVYDFHFNLQMEPGLQLRHNWTR